MSIVQGSYVGEELEVAFFGTLERCDYGVPHSPVWWEVVDIRVEEVYILGVSVTYDSLPKELKQNLSDLAEEVEWN